jgi:hypothetical protein
MKQAYALAGLVLLLSSSSALSLSVDGYLEVQGPAMGFVDLSGSDISHLSQFTGDTYAFTNSIHGWGDFFGDLAYVTSERTLNFDQALLGKGSFVLDQDLSQNVDQIESTINQGVSVCNGLTSSSQSVVVGETSSASSLGVATIADFVLVKAGIGAASNSNVVYNSGQCIAIGNKYVIGPVIAALTSASAFNAVPLMGQTSMAATGLYGTTAKYYSYDTTPDVFARKEINWLGSRFELTVGVDSDNLVRTAAIRIMDQPEG